MNVQEMIEALEKIEDKKLEVRCCESIDDEFRNLWVYDIEFSSTGSSGYEEQGEVRILTSE
tara:strand:+ start:895 stop:1077 length:183 start_codon:yes stop_codon:yes gene_type:complete